MENKGTFSQISYNILAKICSYNSFSELLTKV